MNSTHRLAAIATAMTILASDALAQFFDPFAGNQRIEIRLPVNARDIAVNHARREFYVSFASLNVVDPGVIQTYSLDDGRLLREFSPTLFPDGLDLSPDGTKLYAALFAQAPDLGQVLELDLATGSSRTFEVTTGNGTNSRRIFDVAATSDDRLIVSASDGSLNSALTVVDLRDGSKRRIANNLSIFNTAPYLHISPDEQFVYVGERDQLGLLDLTQPDIPLIKTTIDSGWLIRSAFSNGGTRLHNVSGQILDASTLDVIAELMADGASIPTSGQPAIDAAGNIYVWRPGPTDDVIVFDGNTLEQIGGHDLTRGSNEFGAFELINNDSGFIGLSRDRIILSIPAPMSVTLAAAFGIAACRRRR